MEFTFGFLCLKPRVTLEGARLVIDSPLLVRLATGFCYRRTVIVDSDQRHFEFTTRWFGFSRSRIVSFAEILRLEYRYDDTAVQTGNPWTDSQDSIEWFTIAVILKIDREEITIGRFIGEGSIDEGWRGVLMGDDLYDLRGDQQERSHSLIQVLQAMTGLPLT